MLISDRKMLYSDFESGLGKKYIETFRTTASLPLQWFLLTLLLQGAGACSVLHGGRVWSDEKARKLILSLCT